jgi:hypothetical protein
MTLARLIWIGSGSLIDRINAVDKEAGVQAWATLAGSFGGAFLAGAFAVGSFMLQRGWQRRDTNERVKHLLRRALLRHIGPPWILEYSFIPLAEALVAAQNYISLPDTQLSDFPCSFDLSEIVEGSIAVDAPDIVALIHDIKKSRENIFEAIQWAKTQRLDGQSLNLQKSKAMTALLDTWSRNYWVCQELIKRDVIAIMNFEESSRLILDKLIALNGGLIRRQVANPELAQN